MRTCQELGPPRGPNPASRARGSIMTVQPFGLSPQRIKAAAFTLPVALAAVLISAGPVLGLWLPWAGEEDKIKKTVSDIWQALIKNDMVMLKQNLVGSNVDAFIALQKQAITEHKIKNYRCVINRVKIDPQSKAMAFVEFVKVATFQDGRESSTHDFSVLRKIQGQWKLVTGYDKKRKLPHEQLKQAQDSRTGRAKEVYPVPDEEFPSPSGLPPKYAQ